MFIRLAVLFLIPIGVCALNPHAPFLVTTPPKSGTHLLAKIVKEMTGKTIGYSSTITALDQAEINKLGTSHFYITHAPFSPDNAQLAAKNNLKTILVLRDPRDVIVSYVLWLKKGFGNQLEPDWPKYKNLPIDKILMHFIERYPTKGPQIAPYTTIVEFYNLYLGWEKYHHIYITSFEKLIGPKGGGDANVQLTEVTKISEFLDCPINSQQASHLCANLFGGTTTFREGKIGSWRKYLKPEHISALKTMTGFNDLLIKLGYAKDGNW